MANPLTGHWPKCINLLISLLKKKKLDTNTIKEKNREIALLFLFVALRTKINATKLCCWELVALFSIADFLHFFVVVLVCKKTIVECGILKGKTKKKYNI